MPGKLISTADRKHYDACIHRAAQGFTLHGGEIACHETLLVVLGTAHKEQVKFILSEASARTESDYFELYCPEAATTFEANYVAPVAVDVHLAREKVAETEAAVVFHWNLFDVGDPPASLTSRLLLLPFLGAKDPIQARQ